MLPKSPPKHIADAVRRFDPLLRIRWSREKKKFIVERKVGVRSLLADPVIWRMGQGGQPVARIAPEYSDRYISWRDGYSKIIETDWLDRRLLRFLWESDAYRVGKHYLKVAEENEKKRLALEDKRESDYIRDLSGDVYDHLAYKDGARTSMAGGK